jgi:hypothetical protein
VNLPGQSHHQHPRGEDNRKRAPDGTVPYHGFMVTVHVRHRIARRRPPEPFPQGHLIARSGDAVLLRYRRLLTSVSGKFGYERRGSGHTSPSVRYASLQCRDAFLHCRTTSLSVGYTSRKCRYGSRKCRYGFQKRPVCLPSIGYKSRSVGYTSRMRRYTSRKCRYGSRKRPVCLPGVSGMPPWSVGYASPECRSYVPDVKVSVRRVPVYVPKCPICLPGVAARGPGEPRGRA